MGAKTSQWTHLHFFRRLTCSFYKAKKMADNKAILNTLHTISKCRGPTVLFEKETVGPLYFDKLWHRLDIKLTVFSPFSRCRFLTSGMADTVTRARSDFFPPSWFWSFEFEIWREAISTWLCCRGRGGPGAGGGGGRDARAWRVQFRTHAHKYSNFAHVAAQMPDNKRIQAPEETYCPLLFLAEDEKQSNKPLVG